MDSTIKDKTQRLICIGIPCLNLGGTELQTLNLAKVLCNNSQNVSVLCYFEYNTLMVSQFIESGIKLEFLGLKRGIKFLPLIYKLFRKFKQLKPEIVHVQYMAPGALPIIAARIAGVKKVFATVHQPFSVSHRWYSKLILRSAAFLTSKFISVSQNAENSWFGNSHLFNENIPLSNQPSHFTIHNAVDTFRIEEIISICDKIKIREGLNISQDKLIIGTVSRLRYEKGVDILIDGFAKLLSRYTKAHLLIVGDGPDSKKLYEQAGNSGIRDSITFTGVVDWLEAIKLMGIMDIVAVPSRFEGFGLTAAEAMAAGKPVVASDSFGLSEVVVNEETGLLFPPEEFEMLGKILLLLCENRALSEEFGRNGKERCKSFFGFDLFSRRIASLYS
jgi:L-malate glycosyltransferase